MLLILGTVKVIKGWKRKSRSRSGDEDERQPLLDQETSSISVVTMASEVQNRFSGQILEESLSCLPATPTRLAQDLERIIGK